MSFDQKMVQRTPAFYGLFITLFQVIIRHKKARNRRFSAYYGLFMDNAGVKLEDLVTV